MEDSYIIVKAKEKNSKANLTMYKDNKKILETKAFIGENGITNNKIEGDRKTPIGKYEFGLAFGTKNIVLNNKIKYVKITPNLYWVDDTNSVYYNKLVDITKVNKDWKTAEHLIEYEKQYEYGIEIKVNKENVPGKGSAIFLHCTNNKPTAGCIAVEKQEMIQILKNIDENTKIYIIKEKI